MISRDWQSDLFAPFVTPGVAWLLLTITLAVHVVDEAVHDFLSTYNPIVRSVRERLPLLPLPTFSFGVWLAGLTMTVLPIARAGAIFHEAIAIGKFHGMICAQTPIGSRNVMLIPDAATGIVCPPLLLITPA